MRQQSNIMRCQTCGLESPDNLDFCPHCGVAVIDNKHAPHLGHYRLDAKLGEGGMGVVYQATDEKLHREVAVKVLHPHLLQNENLKERFRREARMHAKLMHPNVVTLLSLYEDGGHMALVMEMVHGKNLKEYLKVHPSLSLVDLVKICDAILSGLEAAHHLGMVHRDLKPANVLLSGDGSVKLMDFGLAKPKKGDDDLTQSGATVGSFRYMAPEQILNQPVDARTDLYAFGILLYQVCTGKLPFDATAGGGGEFEIMEKQVREEAVPPHELVPSLPMALSDLIMRLLAKNPADRPVDCKEVRDDLHALLRQETRDTSAAIRMPTRMASEDSNAEIAKGLILALVRKVTSVFRKRPAPALVKKVTSLFREKTAPLRRTTAVEKRRKEKLPQQPLLKRWQAPLTWGGVALFIAGIGWLLVSVIEMAERPPAAETAVVEPKKEQVEPVKAEVRKTEAEKPAAEVPVAAQAKAAEVKPVAQPRKTTTTKPKRVVKPKPKPKPVYRAKSVTYSVSHKIRRSDNSDINPKSNEYLGGSQVFFTELKDYRWKETLHTFKKGETRLYLDKPVSLSRIVLNKASVGRLNFKDGEVSLAIQDSRGKWTDLFERIDDDVDIAVTITKPASALKDVKGVRVRFKTPEPITVGPIDLIR